MFHWDDGLHVTALGLSVDVVRRQPRGFISHAHADHMARHERALCTPATAALYQHRLGVRPVTELPYGQPYAWREHQLTTYPAGHMWGAAMLLVEHAGASLLYTGDFRLRPGATATLAAPPRADTLIMESTFGQPKYRLPPREEVLEELLEIIQRAWEEDVTPVIYAYATGKAQEVTRLLTAKGVAVMQQRLVWETSEVYERTGCELGVRSPLSLSELERHVVIAPPRGQKGGYALLPPRKRTIALTGWALDHGARHRLGVDVALPFSDHADYDELLECLERVSPNEVYCTHGPAEFVADLRNRGWNAHPLH